ncbi:MAG: SPOR domain-containing protein [Muribaculaceae bacterium]|nr:SPOR domain-containing protein [Muribaculaceae bacterium]
MRLSLLLIVLAALAVFSSCRTSEANYRAAYEKAIEAREDATALDSTVYGRVRREMNITTIATAAGPVELRTQLVRITADGGGIPERLHRYNVVAAQFKQKFNALSLRNRLADGDYPAAFVVETAEPYYYVIVESSHSLDDAKAALEGLDERKLPFVKDPCPFILDATARRTSTRKK